MQDVIAELPKEQAAAKELQKKLVKLQERHGKKAMENALTEAASQLQKAQKSGPPVTDATELKARALLKRAAHVDESLDAALANELQLPSDAKKLKNLKAELKRQ
ncbi:MAG: hypothetical protein GY822_10820 [Deltaproteobacteria bacterium]|nr:hypothetical protein [Deltaproteobacteria bacterium]